MRQERYVAWRGQTRCAASHNSTRTYTGLYRTAPAMIESIPQHARTRTLCSVTSSRCKLRCERKKSQPRTPILTTRHHMLMSTTINKKAVNSNASSPLRPCPSKHHQKINEETLNYQPRTFCTSSAREGRRGITNTQLT